MFFLIIWGRRSRVVLAPPEDQALVQHCASPSCVGRVKVYHLQKYCHLCYIPLFTETIQKLVVCPVCRSKTSLATYQRAQGIMSKTVPQEATVLSSTLPEDKALDGTPSKEEEQDTSNESSRLEIV